MGMISNGMIGGWSGGPVANPILLPDGSTAAPSLALAGNPDTGLYGMPNQLGLSQDGIVRLYLTGSGVTINPNLNATRVIIDNDVMLERDAANTLALKNVNNDQTQRWYGANGAYFQVKTQSELLTIVAAANTPTTMTVPIYATVQGVAVYVVTAIPTAATFTVTLTTQGTTLSNAAVSTAQGSTDLGNNNCPVKSTSAQTITITPNLTPEAATGKVRIVLMYTIPSPPTS